MLAKYPKFSEEFLKEDLDFVSDPTAQIIKVFLETGGDFEKASKNLDSKTVEKLNYLSLKTEAAEELGNLTEKERDIDFHDCLREIKNMAVKARLELLSQEIRSAEIDGNSRQTASLVEKFHQLSKKLTEVS